MRHTLKGDFEMDLRRLRQDSRLKNVEVTEKYSMPNAVFGYPKNSVICVLVKGQYLLMPEGSLQPHGSLAQMITSFASLPDGLKLRVSNKRIEVGALRQSIRDAARNRPEVPALATWCEIAPSDHYRLITSEDELVRMWIEQYMQDSGYNWRHNSEEGQKGVSLTGVLPSIDHDTHKFMITRESGQSFTGVVKLCGDCSLYSVYSHWDGANWVWSSSKGKLLRGNPCLHSLPGYRD